jgi:hypothetical protein
MVPPINTGCPEPDERERERERERGGTDELVVDRDEGMVRREGSCASLAMNEEGLELTVDHMLLHLGTNHDECTLREGGGTLAML